MPAAARGEHNGSAGETHIFGFNNLVVFAHLQKAVLVYARTMCKGITAHNGFIGLNRHTHLRAYHVAQLIKITGINVGKQVDVLVGF